MMLQLRGTRDLPTEEVEIDLEYFVARKTALLDSDRQIMALMSEGKCGEETEGVLLHEQLLELAIT